MSAVVLADLRARNSGFRMRTHYELLRDLNAACESLGDLAHAGIDDTDLAGITRTVAGISRVLTDLRVGGATHAA